MLKGTKIATGAAAVVGAAALALGGAALAQAGTDAGSSTGQESTTGQAERPEGKGRGMRGAHEHTEVTGAEATRVGEAVTAQDSGVTVESVRKDPDGSYDVIGTKDGARVMVEVSADLSSIEVRTRPDGQGRGPRGGGSSTPSQSASPTTDATPSST